MNRKFFMKCARAACVVLARAFGEGTLVLLIMSRYDEALTLGDARDRYFAENGFSASYDDRWVKLRLGSRQVPVLPNTKARIVAVRVHDLHHVATDYGTTWVGEGEISAWELASGCGPYLAAWVLNLAGFGIGFFLSPRRMLRAFVRGRHSKNLYGEGFDALRLSQRVGDLRHELGLDAPEPRATLLDVLAFAGWVLLGMLYNLGGMLSFALLAIALLKMPANEAAKAHASAPPHAPNSAAPVG
jgi:hypothetical protein